ncbi:YheC/YheD family protein [Bacillus dakarensis]|uniref:YheC/YheD family endospore coat-associated protein n=1 Tax=Robertmurraya dakarensis TaxID=1926278 RepID=UPI000981833A|nr:YheC/YheD family protein [Bacillus dakarensis]
MIFYDPFRKEWYQQLSNENYVFGKTGLAIPFKKNLNEGSISFQISCHDGNLLGPLIGIMTSRKNNKSLAGNGLLFKNIQKEVIQKGGLSFVFTPEGLGTKSIEGFCYLPDKDAWIKITVPFPHVVYNRIPFRQAEQTSEFQLAVNIFREKGIPFFNPSFLKKFDLYKLFKNDEDIGKYFPETILINDEALFRLFISKHRNVYLKPNTLSKGKGIYRLTVEQDGSLSLVGLSHQYSYRDLNEFLKERFAILRKKHYIAQCAVSPALLNGERFDFRVLSHFQNGEYLVTGVGIRQADKQNITTHLPNGGRLVPYSRVQNQQHDHFFQVIVNRCGELLSNKKGFFGEFSIDAGMTETGKYVIYEVNAKPMSFDEEEIEASRIQNLCTLFFNLAGFKNPS